MTLNRDDTPKSDEDLWRKHRLIRSLDKLPWRRYSPPNCDPAQIKPLPEIGPDNLSLFLEWYESAVKLVIHDDSLNWTKFYNMAYVNLALTAAYAFAVDKGARPFLWMICAFGVMSGIGFDLTLREGMRCLRAHRCKVDVLDAHFAANHSRKFLFCSNAYNRREALQFGPIIGILFWLGVAITTFWIEPRTTRNVMVPNAVTAPTTPDSR